MHSPVSGCCKTAADASEILHSYCLSTLLLGVPEDQDHRVSSDEKLGDEAVLVDRRRTLLAFARLGYLQQQHIASIDQCCSKAADVVSSSFLAVMTSSKTLAHKQSQH